VAFPVVLVILLYAWGTDRAVKLPPASRVRVAAVQGWTLPDLTQSTREAAARGAQAVCWPELALNNLTQDVYRLSEELGITIVTGFIELRGSGKPYNSAAVISNGEYLGAARKVHLIGKEHFKFAAGKDTRLFSPKGLPTIGAEVCYDTEFTGVTRSLAAKGAKVIFVPNSDPVTSSGILHQLHTAALCIRAAENSVVFVKADSTGLSDIIHPTGWVAAGLPMNNTGQVTGEIIVGSGPTIYTRTGDWFAWLSIIVAAAIILSTYQKRN
jgi:apolipoprotein N-acyltransferase